MQCPNYNGETCTIRRLIGEAHANLVSRLMWQTHRIRHLEDQLRKLKGEDDDTDK